MPIKERKAKLQRYNKYETSERGKRKRDRKIGCDDGVFNPGLFDMSMKKLHLENKIIIM
jgi:hypothetical protein